MDFNSWFLSLLGMANDRSIHQSQQRAEVSRLIAEVAGDSGRALDIINSAMPRLTRRCTQICGQNSDLCDGMIKVLNEQREQALQVIAMTDDLKRQISKANAGIDWDNALHRCQEWRATASRAVPWVENIVNRYDAILYEAGAR